MPIGFSLKQVRYIRMGRLNSPILYKYNKLDEVEVEKYIIEMINITKVFPEYCANDNITLRLRKVKSTPYWEKMVLVNQL